MESDALAVAADGALTSLPPGEPLRIAQGALVVDLAPAAGGRIAQISNDGVDWLVGHGGGNAAMIAWGCFPMLPWAGRVRRGAFRFQDAPWQLQCNLGAHAVHGVAFALPWRIEDAAPDRAELSLILPHDERWPFGGVARQRIRVADASLHLELSLTAGDEALPAVIGWHPWFRKPDRLEFRPSGCFPRDAEGIAVPPPVAPPPAPWDDCFVNTEPVLLHRGGQRLRLTSSCTNWVIYDELAHATCVEPQSGPPDAFNHDPTVLVPGASLVASFHMDWL